MASVFITGSADGLGRLAAQRLVKLGHDVVFMTSSCMGATGTAPKRRCMPSLAPARHWWAI